MHFIKKIKYDNLIILFGSCYFAHNLYSKYFKKLVKSHSFESDIIDVGNYIDSEYVCDSIDFKKSNFKDNDCNFTKKESVFIEDKKISKINLSNKLTKLLKNINHETIDKDELILIQSVKLLMDYINNQDLNEYELNDSIKLFIRNSKKNIKQNNKISYNNLLSGEILNYLASI